MPSLTVRVYQNWLKCRQIQSRKQNACWHQIHMRENGGSLDFNFISLPKPVVDKNWVCQHCLLIFGKWCCVRCSNLFRLYQWHIYWMFPLFRTWIDFRFTVLVCSLYRSWALSISLCALIQSKVYAAGNTFFCISDAKYVMFRVGWCKSLKGSVTPVNVI